MNWNNFFFGENAVQNYVSEIFGITVGVLIVNQIVKHRERKRNRPLKQMAYSLLFDELNKLLYDFLPNDFIDIAPYDVYFGSYSTFVIQTVKKHEDYELSNSINRDLESDINSIKLLNNPILNSPEHKNLIILNLYYMDHKVKTIINFETMLKDIILYHGQHLDAKVIVEINEIRLLIKKHFQTYKAEIKIVEDMDKVYLPGLVPYLVKKVVVLWDELYAKRTK